METMDTGANVNHDFTIENTNEELSALSTEDLEKLVKAEETKLMANAESKVEPVITEVPTPVEIKKVETKIETEAPIVEQPNVDIPVKFQKTDGSLDEDKVAKSKASLTEVLNMEKEFTKLRQANKVTTPVQAPQTQQTNSFQEQLEQDMDCLLYTSPSPRDGLLSRMPSSA